MFEMRNDSDYDNFFILNKEDVVEQFENATKFLEVIKEFLLSKGVKFN